MNRIFGPVTLTLFIFPWWRHFLHSPRNSIGKPSTNMFCLVKSQNLNLRLTDSEVTGAILTIRILRFGTAIWKRFYAQNSIKLIFETCVPWDFNTIHYVYAHKGHFQIRLHATRWIQSFHFQFENVLFFILPKCIWMLKTTFQIQINVTYILVSAHIFFSVFLIAS